MSDLPKVKHRLGNRDSQLCRHRVVEILVVGGPPERIIDDVGSLKDGVLQVAAVILDFMRNAIDDDAVSCGLAHPRAAQLYKFGCHTILLPKLVDTHDKSRRKAVFPPAEKANFFHVRAPVRVLWNCFSFDRRQFTACAEEVRGSLTPPRVSATRCRTTAFSRQSPDRRATAGPRWCLRS